MASVQTCLSMIMYKINCTKHVTVTQHQKRAVRFEFEGFWKSGQNCDLIMGHDPTDVKKFVVNVTLQTENYVYRYHLPNAATRSLHAARTASNFRRAIDCTPVDPLQ